MNEKQLLSLECARAGQLSFHLNRLKRQKQHPIFLFKV